ncbi:facilitated trehalose transporter Tret1-like [Trichogramma pretiosum]|uniref:facilitated trehalose transporter Tret1-like n=1 Tax=Trichogramma pretiosum TaxID=7493 RepID=UPI0006C9E328|nr:facilitated trehalose transporter Tret1-like [Trichogramma pretiosum]
MTDEKSRSDEEELDVVQKLLATAKVHADHEQQRDSRSALLRRQWSLNANFLLTIMLCGMANGHSAILLQQMTTTTTTNSTDDDRYSLLLEQGELFGQPLIHLDSVELQSWVASSMALFMCPGSWLLAASSRRLGRKPLLCSAVALLSAGWLLLAWAPNVACVLIARSLSGLGLGLLGALVPVYQAECSVAWLRPTLNAACAVSFSLGLLLCHALGTWFSWRSTAGVGGLLSLASLGLAAGLLTESPIWLSRRGRPAEAVLAWQAQRGNGWDIAELESLLLAHDKSGVERSEVEYDTAAFWKPLGIVLAMFGCAQFSGMGAIAYYCVQMISELAGPENAYLGTLGLDASRLVASLSLTALTRRYSTRRLYLASALACSVFLCLLSASIVLKQSRWIPTWTPLALLLCYEVACIAGLGPLPWTYCGELFSSAHKEVGVGLASTYNFFLFFAVIKVNPYLFGAILPWGTFLLYGCATLAGFALLCFVLPDTRNKSLKEIEAMFVKT